MPNIRSTPLRLRLSERGKETIARIAAEIIDEMRAAQEPVGWPPSIPTTGPWRERFEARVQQAVQDEFSLT